MSSINDLIRKHEAHRAGGINLIASENALPEPARKALASDLQGRYHSDWYGGTRHVRDLIRRVEELACEVFRADHAVVSAVSGHLCDLAALFTYTRPGDAVAILPFSAGGYPLDFGRFGRARHDLPVRGGGFEPETRDLSLPEAVTLVMAGASYIPFPHDVEGLRAPGRPVVYDGSHVMGLIASGAFQDPLGEGAEALIGSTHKSLPGPQGGLVVTRSSDAAQRFRSVLDFDLDKGIGLVDNPHPARIAALGIALEQLLADRDYGKRVVANAAALARALEEEGLPVRFRERGYTESHQVFLDLPSEEARALCKKLEKEGVFIDVAGRMGTAEVTSRGMEPDDMPGIAKRLASAYAAMKKS